MWLVLRVGARPCLHGNARVGCLRPHAAGIMHDPPRPKRQPILLGWMWRSTVVNALILTGRPPRNEMLPSTSLHKAQWYLANYALSTSTSRQTVAAVSERRKRKASCCVSTSGASTTTWASAAPRRSCRPRVPTGQRSVSRSHRGSRTQRVPPVDTAYASERVCRNGIGRRLKQRMRVDRTVWSSKRSWMGI